jgi:hypothetical protein
MLWKFGAPDQVTQPLNHVRSIGFAKSQRFAGSALCKHLNIVVPQLPVCFALESQLPGPATPERMQPSELFGPDRGDLSSATHHGALFESSSRLDSLHTTPSFKTTLGILLALAIPLLHRARAEVTAFLSKISFLAPSD